MVYCNVIYTGLPLRLFGTLVFFWWIPEASETQYCCTLYLTATLFTIVRVDSLGPIQGRTL